MVTAVNSYGESPPTNEVQVLEPLALQSGGSPMASVIYTIQRLSYAFAGRGIAFGDYRLAPNSDLTDRGFTGHRHNNMPTMTWG